MTFPLRLITLHLSHIGFTDGLTFIVILPNNGAIPVCEKFVLLLLRGHCALGAPHDTTLGEVIGAHFQFYRVAGQHSDGVDAKFAGNISGDFVAVTESYAELRIAERLDDYAFNLDYIVF